MVLVRSFMSEISPILCLSVSRLCCSLLKRAIVPVYERLAAKDHSEELGRILCQMINMLPRLHNPRTPYQIHSRVPHPPCHTCRSLRAAGRR